MKNQCFGGEYMGEVFDHMMKRMSHRRQKRWWNAYILFYERMDAAGTEEISNRGSVHKQNVQFMHNRMQYSLEYFQFAKKLLTCNGVYLTPPP
ncbi:hypothetical protein AAFF_G00042650, partial [Aldrovandia affinis]